MDDAEAYRQEWATKTGRNPREVYVPEALRRGLCPRGPYRSEHVSYRVEYECSFEGGCEHFPGPTEALHAGDREQPVRVRECPPGVHSMFDFCPGRAVCEGGDA